MHELSIALEICRMAEDHLGPETARLVALGVTVGEDAGIEPDNLAFCLETLLADPPFGGAVPRIQCQPGNALHLGYLEIDDGDPND